MNEFSHEDELRIRDRYREFTEYLIKNKLTVTTMESATSGQLASLITDTEGASAVMKGAFVTYSNEAKIMQGVPADVIEKYSVYSEQTAAAMADACRRTYGADIGIGVTGTFGNQDPANPEASQPGEVYVGISLERGTFTKLFELPALETRLMYKMKTAELVLDFLQKKGTDYEI